MQFTKHTLYACRVLIYLVVMQEKRTTIQSISDTYGVSETHLMNVVNELSSKGWVEFTRGENGGICLGESVENINKTAVLACIIHEDLASNRQSVNLEITVILLETQ